MKRVLSLILAISMVMSMFTFSFAGSSLKDVAGTDYESAVEALVELGIVNGYEDGTYRPEQNVSRAEMAKLLVVAAGLEPAAKLAEGATKFADVNGGWASGYVNVASEYGYVMGDPDGNFRPDDTVSYAEAATMALRVLGYKSVVEAKGTWPTNYIAKAEDLELLEDITFDAYDSGAARGNVAILMWNMLKTRMWDVVGESEGDGLHYEADRVMLNVKFPDYSYSYAEFVDFRVNGDGEVEITLDDVYGKYTGSLDQDTYVYAANDFYTFVPGTEVEVLVNEEDETLLTMVRTGRDSFAEGLKADIDDEYDSLTDAAYDYVYAMIEKKDASESVLLTIESDYIYKTEVKDDYIRLNKIKKEFEDFDDVEVIVAGDERAQIKSVEVDDVLSKVTIGKEVFYVLSNETVEGKLTRYTRTEPLEDGTTYSLIVVDGKEYVVDPKATYVVDRDDTKEFEKGNKLANINDTTMLEDMEDEEVIVYLDFAGRVARVEFDGELKDEEASSYAFYATADSIDYEDKKYLAQGENEADEKELVFAKNSDLYFGGSPVTPSAVYFMEPTIFEGMFGWVELDEDDEVLNYVAIARATSGDDPAWDTFLYDDMLPADEEDENIYYYVSDLLVASYDDKTTSLRDARDEEIVDIDDDVVVVTLTYDDNGTKKEKDDTRTVEFSEGLSALAELDEDNIMYIEFVDETNDKSSVEYVIVFAENKSVDTDLAAKLTKVGDNLLDGYYPFYVNDEHGPEDVLRGPSAEADAIEALLGGAIVYSTELNRNDKLVAEIRASMSIEEMEDAFAENLGDPAEYTVVKEVKAGKVQFSGDVNKYAMIELIDPDYDTAVFEDCMFVLVEVNPDAEKAADFVDSVEAIEEDDIAVDMFSAEDIVVKAADDAEVVFILRGFDFDATDDEEEDNGSEDDGEGEDAPTAETVTITWNVAGTKVTSEVVLGTIITAAPETVVVPEGQEISGWVEVKDGKAEDVDLSTTYAFAAMELTAKLTAVQAPTHDPDLDAGSGS